MVKVYASSVVDAPRELGIEGGDFSSGVAGMLGRVPAQGESKK